MRNATLNASVRALAPNHDATSSSRANPVRREAKVHSETVDADLKRLTPLVYVGYNRGFAVNIHRHSKEIHHGLW
jgi:hypothetical protein